MRVLAIIYADVNLIRRGYIHQYTDPPHRRLLRSRSERPPCQSAAETSNELSSSNVDPHLTSPLVDHGSRNRQTISRLKMEVCGRLHGGPMAKKFAAFLQCKMTRMARNRSADRSPI
jgi:hypothetical protein